MLTSPKDDKDAVVDVQDSPLIIYLRAFLFVAGLGMALVVAATLGLPALFATYNHDQVSVGPWYYAIYTGVVLLAGLGAVVGKTAVGTSALISSDGVVVNHNRRSRRILWSDLHPSAAVITGDVRFSVSGQTPVFMTPRLAKEVILSKWAPPWDVPRSVRNRLDLAGCVRL